LPISETLVAKVPDVRFWHIPELTARRAYLPVTTAKETRNKVIAAKPCASSRHAQPPVATWTFRPASRETACYTRLGERRSNTEAAMFPQKSSSARLTKSVCLIAALSAVAPVAIAGRAVADPLDASKAANEQCLANGFPHDTCCKGSGGTWDPDKSECASPGPSVAAPSVPSSGGGEVKTPDTMSKTPTQKEPSSQ
jgi:hypothetical protein